MTLKSDPLFHVGDLVLGIYDFVDYLYYGAYHSKEPTLPPEHVGVVIVVSAEQHYFDGWIYTVLCVDGTRRFFLGDELQKL